ncbi:hypothetical protein O181_024413 [Austropuccinia psidii MF-1]|uniref:No apical meristem-associated C-terminal domain-containing protein n=1 Tax=Austropuccinia psidii MF-1 TaxID=1389203 RepID=A0A9Q3CIX6_9BASI|nr:hypothetical protein [Austropuccinia psidii MF-1]
MSAYNVLSNAPKWNHHMQYLEKSTSKQDISASSTSVQSDFPKPLGQKRSRMLLAASKATQSKITTESQKRLADNSKKKSESLAEKIEALENISEDLIMSKDIEKNS